MPLSVLSLFITPNGSIISATDVRYANNFAVTVSLCTGNTYIMVPPRNTTALEGSRVKLSCQAEAFPNNVTYEWRRHNDDDDEEVPPTSRTTVYADGSLVFTSVDVTDAGWYTCRPTNGLGLTPEARAYLNVTCKSLKRSSSHCYFRPDKKDRFFCWTILLYYQVAHVVYR